MTILPKSLAIAVNFGGERSIGIQTETRKVSAGKPRPTSKRNACPVCGNDTGKCRTFDGSDLVLCMESDSAAPGFRYLGQTRDYLWGKFIPEGDDRPAPQQKEYSPKVEERRVVPDGIKDREYRAILNQLFLNDRQTPKDFYARIASIAVDGSGIPRPLWELNTRLLPNFLIESDGTVTHPLYDELGWHFARFSYRANDRSNEFGIAIGDTWQIILLDNSPRGYRYVAPKGIGNRAFFPRLDDETIVKICQRYAIDPATIGEDPWETFKDRQLPLTVTEGAKKALATIGQGVLACAVYGCSCLGSPDLEGWQNLIIGMDQDNGFDSHGHSKRGKTISAVLGGVKTHLKPLGVNVQFIAWDYRHGKGIDDLLVHSPDRFWEAINNPKNSLLNIKDSIALDIKPDYIITTREELEALLPTIEGKLTIIDAPTGAGKTEAMGVLTNNHNLSHIGLTPLRSLSVGMANTLDLGVFNDGDRRDIDDRVCACINSAFKIRPPRSYNLYLDEYEASLDSLYRGSLCKEKRLQRIQGFEKLAHNADRIFAMSATALARDIRKLESIAGEKAIVIRFTPNTFKKAPVHLTIGDGEKGSNATAFNMVLESLASDIRAGLSAIVACDYANSQGASEVGLMGIHAWGLQPDHVLIYSRDTLQDDRIIAFRAAPDKGQWLVENGIRLFSYSPAMASGVSIKDPIGVRIFDTRYAFLNGNSIAPAQAVQILNRYRSSIPVTAYCALRGSFTPLIRGAYKELDSDAKRLNRHIGGGFGVDRYALECDRALSFQFSQYAEAFRYWLERDGHEVAIDLVSHVEEISRPNLKNEIRQWRAEPIVAEGNATPIAPAMARILSEKPEPTIAETLRMKAFRVREFVGKQWDDPIVADDVLLEEFGRGTKRLNLLGAMFFPGNDRDEAEFLHDANLIPCRAELWEKLGIFEILAYCLKNSYSQNDPTIRSWWDGLQRYSNEFARFPRLLGFNVPIVNGDYATAIKAIGMMLRSLGFKTKSVRSRTNGLIRVYSVTPESMQMNADRVARLLLRKERAGDPERGKALYLAMDLAPTILPDRHDGRAILPDRHDGAGNSPPDDGH